jgi:hypothetical protein
MGNPVPELGTPERRKPRSAGVFCPKCFFGSRRRIRGGAASKLVGRFCGWIRNGTLSDEIP